MSRTSHHHIVIKADVGTLQVNVDLDLSAPWTVLFGPSGSGKSSILRSICGLLPGSQSLSSRPTNPQPLSSRPTNPQPSSSRPTNGSGETPVFRLPPHRRNLAYAPQGAVLFPHLNVRENIAFALTTRRLPGKIDDLLDLFVLTSLANRMPHDLSGGERQRVSLARAFAVPKPGLILLDEPFTGLDRSLRDTLLPRMQDHLATRNIPALSVTHDIEEALLLNAEVIRIADGKTIAQGPATEVLAAERKSVLKALRIS